MTITLTGSDFKDVLSLIACMEITYIRKADECKARGQRFMAEHWKQEAELAHGLYQRLKRQELKEAS